MNKLLTNYNIAKYSIKYFFLFVVTAMTVEWAGKLCTVNDTFTNILGTTLFAGLFLSWVLLLKSDVTKLVKNLSETNKNNKEDNK